MKENKDLPVVVIVGRPNVGKSTLFNAILGTRRSIVGDEPGITRDRISGVAEHRGRRFELVDTGGIVPDDPEIIPGEIFKQARVALESASHIIYVIDGRTEITGADRELARLLHTLGKPIALAVNKIDDPKRENLTAEFWALGFNHLFPVSAEHRLGLDDLLDHAAAGFPVSEEEEAGEGPRKIRVAIIGRPNVGKSTLLNALCGMERAIVTPIAGTTRDAVDESVLHEGVEYVFVDTAGIRRKGKTKLMAEKLSVVMARRHIEQADVALVVIDATEGVVAIDANIAGYAHEAGKPVVIVLNKWDAVEKRDKRAFVERVREALRYLDYAPVAFLSAKTGAGVSQLFGLIRRGDQEAARRIPTAELNKFFGTLETELDLAVRYLTQAGIRPPTFVVFKDSAKPLHFSKSRYIANRLRERFGFAGTPIVIKAKSKNAKRRR
jgi:GTP-binding protein